MCVFPYPVGQRQEVDIWRRGDNEIQNRGDDDSLTIEKLHTQQALLQKLWLWNSLEKQNEAVLMSRTRNTRQKIDMRVIKDLHRRLTSS